jgi:hypothetical protein
MASQFLYSSWDNLHLTAWATLTLVNSSTMTQEVSQLAAATTQVKLCPYDEEELAIWFRLIEAQFAGAGIKSQRLHYANTLANLPKQVLWDILNTVNLCNNSDQPFDDLKKCFAGTVWPE